VNGLRRIASPLILSFFMAGILAAAPDNLTQRLDSLVRAFHGTAGIYMRNIRTGETITINADTLFPTASMIKVTILCGIFDKLERGELKYNQTLVYRDSLKYDDGICGSLKDSSTVTLADLVTLMICFSDNNASRWLQSIAGTGTIINSWLGHHGFEKTRVNAKTAERDAMYERYGWGMTTPREIAGLLAGIAGGTFFHPGTTAEMIRVLGTTSWTGEALSEIPPTVKVLSKQGAVDRSKSEVVLVYAPSGPYVFSVITKGQTDTRWEYDNEGYVLLRTVSRLFWEYAEPSSTWQPAGEGKKWEK
jgi:beta-lactamase class A